MGFGKYLVKLLEILPYGFFLRLYPHFKKSKVADFADYAFCNVFDKKSRILNKKGKYLDKVKRKGKLCFIEKGIWNYSLANFCFVKNMLANIIWCVECGYIPVVSLIPSGQRDEADTKYLWDMFYQQPLMCDNKSRQKKHRVCPIISSSISPSFNDARNKDMIAKWNVLLDLFVKYNSKTLDYFDSEYKELIENKSIIACVLRSTDYTKLKPKGHPIQPEIKDVFAKIREVMNNNPIDGIYIATEDENIADAFRNEFPGLILENKRQYYSGKYTEGDLSHIADVHFERDNDDYFKMLEYLSSMNLVSKCDFLVTGLSGGSEMAIYRNGNKYKYSYVFDKGVY